jgi:hypothetical protein
VKPSVGCTKREWAHSASAADAAAAAKPVPGRRRSRSRSRGGGVAAATASAVPTARGTRRVLKFSTVTQLQPRKIPVKMGPLQLQRRLCE